MRIRMLARGALYSIAVIYFIKAVTYVSIVQVIAGVKVIMALFFAKTLSKIAGVWPVARRYKYSRTDASYLTLMMATGLTFGTISSLYGLTHHFINQSQYTELVTVVIATAIIPTLIAQIRFQPTEEVLEAESGGLEEIEVGSKFR